jgi:hypothetical protein
LQRNALARCSCAAREPFRAVSRSARQVHYGARALQSAAGALQVDFTQPPSREPDMHFERLEVRAS